MIRKSALVAFVAAALVAAPQAQAAEAAPSAGTWLVAQLTDGERVLRVPGDPASVDHGLTADAVYALAAAGVGRSSIDKVTAWLTSPEEFRYFVGDGASESYVGGITKLALVAQTLGEDPKTFGGADLLERLAARQEATGRYRDLGFDATNAFTQALAIIVLKRAEQPLDKPLAFQVSTQCPDGGFPIAFQQPTCTSDMDATAMVLQALLAAGEKTASAKALTWLEKQQQADGGFRAAGVPGAPPSPANANSTGLAVGALFAGGRTAAVEKAVVFLESLQVGCSGPVAQRGGIAYDASGFDPSTAARATAQGMLGLARVSLADVSAAGAKPGLPAIECAPAPTPDPTTPDPTTPRPTTQAPAGADVLANPPIANTGPEQVVPLTLAGSLAVALGAGLVFVARRRKVGA